MFKNCGQEPQFRQFSGWRHANLPPAAVDGTATYTGASDFRFIQISPNGQYLRDTCFFGV